MDGLDPWAYPEIDALCRLSRLIVQCDACGMSNRPGEPAHLCICASGWYCSDECCPVCNGSLTYSLAEFLQVSKNRTDARERSDIARKRSAARSPEWRRDHGQKMKAYWAKRRAARA